MSGETWFPALREQAGLRDSLGGVMNARVPSDQLAALLDIVEAAQECWQVISPNGNDRFQMAAHNRLRDALLRAKP